MVAFASSSFDWSTSSWEVPPPPTKDERISNLFHQAQKFVDLFTNRLLGQLVCHPELDFDHVFHLIRLPEGVTEEAIFRKAQPRVLADEFHLAVDADTNQGDWLAVAILVARWLDWYGIPLNQCRSESPQLKLYYSGDQKKTVATLGALINQGHGPYSISEMVRPYFQRETSTPLPSELPTTTRELTRRRLLERLVTSYRDPGPEGWISIYSMDNGSASSIDITAALQERIRHFRTAIGTLVSRRARQRPRDDQLSFLCFYGRASKSAVRDLDRDECDQAALIVAHDFGRWLDANGIDWEMKTTYSWSIIPPTFNSYTELVIKFDTRNLVSAINWLNKAP